MSQPARRTGLAQCRTRNGWPSLRPQRAPAQVGQASRRARPPAEAARRASSAPPGPARARPGRRAPAQAEVPAAAPRQAAPIPAAALPPSSEELAARAGLVLVARAARRQSRPSSVPAARPSSGQRVARRLRARPRKGAAAARRLRARAKRAAAAAGAAAAAASAAPPPPRHSWRRRATNTRALLQSRATGRARCRSSCNGWQAPAMLRQPGQHPCPAPCPTNPLHTALCCEHEA